MRSRSTHSGLDGSPFVTKAMLLLKFAGLEFSEDRGGYRKAPKDFDADLTPEQKAAAWAIEKMCEDITIWL